MSDTSTGGGISDLVASQIRTGVPILVGGIVSWVTTLGVTINDQLSAGLISLIGFAAALVWYLIVRWLEQRFPKFGWLLGVARKPVYVDPSTPTGGAPLIGK